MTSPPAVSWGNPSRYYAQEGAGATGAHRERCSDLFRPANHWAALLEQASPGVRGTVERSYRRWNSALRDCIRAETALRLSVGDEVRGVPVRIVDGMPRSFAEAIEPFVGMGWLLLNRSAVEAASLGASFLAEHLGEARSLLHDPPDLARLDEFTRVCKTSLRLLKKLDEAEALKRIVEIEEDVLGAYFFCVPEIRLYWMVIGIIAAALGVSAEALTIVVLAHELAHAYTHLGFDIDNEQWETPALAEADLHIVEGLAQFYTGVVCKRIEPRMPAAIRAYKALLARQSGPYKAHLNWAGGDERAGEIIRVAMIECRSRRITEYEDFCRAIERHRRQVRGRDRSGGINR